MSKYSHSLFFLLFLFLIQSQVLCQPLYEKGYYIDNLNNRFEGYIDRTNLSSSQDYINFKSSKKSTAVQLFPNQVSKVFVSDIHIESNTVLIDTTAFVTSEKRAPSFTRKNVFLFNLIDGEISLLEYRTEKSSLFFVQESPDQASFQLIHKRYIGRNELLFNNNDFRKQLDSLIVNLKSELEIDTEKVLYTSKSLSDLFIKLNDSRNYTFQNYSNQRLISPRYLNFAVITGLRFSRITSKETITGNTFFSLEDVSLSNFGLELEYLLPSLKNQFSIFGRGEIATGDTRLDTVLLTSGLQQINTNLDYLFITIGIRGYFQLSNATKLYADAGVSKPFTIGDGINIRHEIRPDFDYQRKIITPSFGAGVIVFNRFSLESRFEFMNTVLNKNDELNNISYSSFTINLKIFFKSYYSIWD
tara:strand:+ start:5020 stop:6267 length:1248 start_codon:yes stop_codon:yes gene_type:complete